MPIYVYWGEDDFAMGRAIALLRDRFVDPTWESFNYSSFSPELADSVIQGLNSAMTPPFGAGGRLVWLADTTICQQCSPENLAELQRTLPVIPAETTLLLTSRQKPDERLKSSQLLKKFAQFQEFSLISPWKTELLEQSVREAAASVKVNLTAGCVALLVEAVGNDTRQLYNELEKLQLYAAGTNKPLNEEAVTKLVRFNTQNSLQLAVAIRTGNTGKALTLVADLLNACEPGLRIVATLIGQFRTWLWIKLMIESGEKDPKAIAQAAEVGNHKRIYFLQQEVRPLSVQQLTSVLPLLLELEVSLKQGQQEMSTLQIKVMELCQICRV